METGSRFNSYNNMSIINVVRSINKIYKLNVCPWRLFSHRFCSKKPKEAVRIRDLFSSCTILRHSFSETKLISHGLNFALEAHNYTSTNECYRITFSIFFEYFTITKNGEKTISRDIIYLRSLGILLISVNGDTRRRTLWPDVERWRGELYSYLCTYYRRRLIFFPLFSISLLS